MQVESESEAGRQKLGGGPAGGQWRARWGRGAALAGRPSVWIALTLGLVVAEYVSPEYVNVRPLFVLPVALAAWFGPLRWALVIAVVPPVLRLSYYVLGHWDPPRLIGDAVLNAVFRAAAFAFIAVLIERARRARELQREVTMLRGLLPICMYCKRIQDADERWQTVEQYIGARSEAQFTHRVCPACSDTHRHVFLGSR
jgi:hypothetical protein